MGENGPDVFQRQEVRDALDFRLNVERQLIFGHYFELKLHNLVCSEVNYDTQRRPYCKYLVYRHHLTRNTQYIGSTTGVNF